MTKLGKALTAAAAMVVGLATPNAAFACRPTIGDFVWLDVNGNGLQDPGEPGIANVRVTLETPEGVLIASVLTDASGYYVFTTPSKTVPPLCEAPYIVKAETPAGMTQTLLHVGTDKMLDSNDPAGAAADTHDYGPPVNEWSAPFDLSIDFGFTPVVVCNGTIGDFVWTDLNNNGRQDAGESGIPDVTMTLNGGTPQATSSGGGYLFTDLCAGTHTVCATTPVGFQPSPAKAAGVADDVNSDGTANGLGQSCATVTLSTGSSIDLTTDFGFWKTPVQGPGTGTPGFWKNHPEAWPVDSIVVGGVSYSLDAAIAVMKVNSVDKTYSMFEHLVSAKLNVLVGNDSSCIASTIAAADAWLATYPLGSKIKANSVAWRTGEPLKNELDAYNNGDRCAPHRN